MNRASAADGPVAARRRALGAWRTGLGLALLGGAGWGLWRDVAWLAQPFYVWAWAGYLVAVDGFAAWRRGHSLFTTRRRFVLPLAVSSVTFWFLFELLNLHLKNWYYVGVLPSATPAELLGAALFTFAAFSTVFLGIFATYEALTASSLWRGWRGEPGELARWVSYAVQALGLAMAGAALASPHYLAPLIWGSFSLVVDPWNYRRGTRSILRDLEAREWGVVARFALAGLVCGFLWESFNFFAPQKWIYTVRGLEHWKLFEMPLLGFLGFPALAFDALAGFALFSSLLLGGETWEHPGDLGYRVRTHRRARRAAFWGFMALLPLLWWGVTDAVMYVNVGSVQLELDDFVSGREREALEELGVERPRQLLRLARREGGRERARAALGRSPAELEELLEAVSLASHKGIGAKHAAWLAELGIRRVADLRGRDPVELHARLAAAHEDPPRLDMVRVWVLASRRPGIVQWRPQP